MEFNKEIYFTGDNRFMVFLVSGYSFTGFNEFHLLMEWVPGGRFLEEM